MNQLLRNTEIRTYQQETSSFATTQKIKFVDELTTQSISYF